MGYKTFSKEQFANSIPFYDEKGVWLDGTAIMNVCEKEYIQSFVRKLVKKLGVKSVVELGFGLGYSASVFEELCDVHVIIEANKHVFDKAVKWCRNKKTRVVYGFAQDVKFDWCFDLLFDDRAEYVYLDDWIPLYNYNFRHYHRFHVPREVLQNGKC